MARLSSATNSTWTITAKNKTNKLQICIACELVVKYSCVCGLPNVSGFSLEEISCFLRSIQK